MNVLFILKATALTLTVQTLKVLTCVAVTLDMDTTLMILAEKETSTALVSYRRWFLTTLVNC